jgi:hypothetical protein
VIESIALTVAIVAAMVRVWLLPSPNMRWFAAYLYATLARGLALWWASHTSRQAYGDVWGYSEPLIAVLWIAMALELYVRVAALYPGLNRPSWAAVAIGVAMLATWLTLVEPHANRLQSIFLLRRVTASVLAVAIALLAILFGYFRNSLPRNAVVHAATMAFYFLTQAGGYFAANLTGKIVDWGAVASWGAIASYAAWALLLTSRGELRPSFQSEFTEDELARAGENVDETMRIARLIGRGRKGG